MVRNLAIRKVLPRWPARRCQNNGLPRVVIESTTSSVSSSGRRTRIGPRDPTMSSNRLATWYATEGLPSGATSGRPAAMYFGTSDGRGEEVLEALACGSRTVRAPRSGRRKFDVAAAGGRFRQRRRRLRIRGVSVAQVVHRAALHHYRAFCKMRCQRLGLWPQRSDKPHEKPSAANRGLPLVPRNRRRIAGSGRSGTRGKARCCRKAMRLPKITSGGRKPPANSM